MTTDSVSTDRVPTDNDSRFPGAVTVFRRDQRSGALRQLPGRLGCVSRSGLGGCTRGRGLHGPSEALVSPDGRFVYVTGAGDDRGQHREAGLAIFTRDAGSGALSQPAGTPPCARQRFPSEEGCSFAPGLDVTADAVLSPDGSSLYFSSLNFSSDRGRLTAMRRDTATGELSTIGCLNTLSISDPGCGVARGLQGVDSLAISPDGHNLYASGMHGDIDILYSTQIAVLARDPSSGALSQLEGDRGCVHQSGLSNEGCARARRGLEGHAGDVAVSPSGAAVFVATVDGLAVLDRDPLTGALSPRPGRSGCLLPRARVGCRGGLPPHLSVQMTAPTARSPALYLTASDGIAVVRLSDPADR